MKINQLTASRIKDLRNEAGLTAEAMAQNLNISKSAYSQMENGHVEITLTRVELLAEIFNVPIEEILPSAVKNHQTFSNINGGINGNNNTHNTHTFNNFVADERNLDKLMNLIKSAIQGNMDK